MALVTVRRVRSGPSGIAIRPMHWDRSLVTQDDGGNTQRSRSVPSGIATRPMHWDRSFVTQDDAGNTQRSRSVPSGVAVSSVHWDRSFVTQDDGGNTRRSRSVPSDVAVSSMHWDRSFVPQDDGVTRATSDLGSGSPVSSLRASYLRTGPSFLRVATPSGQPAACSPASATPVRASAGSALCRLPRRARGGRCGRSSPGASPVRPRAPLRSHPPAACAGR